MECGTLNRKTRTTGEAHDLHETYRSYQLDVARVIAVRLAQEHGDVHVKMIRPEMVRLGYFARATEESIEALQGPDERWFGSVFRAPAGLPMIWEKTGGRAPRGDRSRNTHGGDTVTVWRLREGADLTPYATMPPVPTNVPVAPPKPVAREVVVVPFDRMAAAAELRVIGGQHVYSANTLAMLAWLEG